MALESRVSASSSFSSSAGRGLRIKDMRAQKPICNRGWYHLMSIDITRARQRAWARPTPGAQHRFPNAGLPTAVGRRIRARGLRENRNH